MTWLLNNWDQVLVALYQHIVISATSIGIAFVLSLVIGIWAARHDLVFQWSIAISGLLYTIPTLAFLALLIPVVGLGRTNAIICGRCCSSIPRCGKSIPTSSTLRAEWA